jgi:signal recognition particle receptor subunit beta
MKTSIASVLLSETQDDPTGPAKQIRLLDLPGHPRLQDDVKAHLPDADGLVFVVDVQALLKNAGSIAE